MFKLFLTWFPAPPDPHYWKFFDIDGIVTPLYGVLQLYKRSYRDFLSSSTYGLKNVLGLLSTLIIDSQPIPLRKGDPRFFPQHAILNMQHTLGADILVHRDYPLVSAPRDVWEKLVRKTLINAEAALTYSEKIGKPIILVVQGWSPETYVEMAERFVELGATHLGVGSLLRFGSQKERCRIVREIREAVGRKVWLHAFGVFSPGSVECLERHVDSIDVSTPAKSAAMRELLLYRDDRLVRVKLSTPNGLNTLRTLSESGDGLERTLASRTLEAKTFTQLKHSLALLNAYEMLKWAGDRRRG